MRYTKEIREEIVSAFATRHNGQYDPKLFFSEVRDAGHDHPAHDWFEWNMEAGWLEHNLARARAFAHGITIRTEVRTIAANPFTIVVRPEEEREVELPMLLSHGTSRSKGGGYVMADPASVVDMRELCRQAASQLSSWLRRNDAALIFAGCSSELFHKQLGLLEKAASSEEEAA
jgi:hypothetical protein